MVITYFLVTFNSIVLNCELQILMNVLKAFIGVIVMKLAVTLKGVTPALASVDTQEMTILAWVIA